MAVNTHEEGGGWWEECDAAPGRREAKVVLSSPRATFQTADYFQWFYIPQQHWGSRSGWTRQILFYSEYKNPPPKKQKETTSRRRGPPPIRPALGAICGLSQIFISPPRNPQLFLPLVL